MRTARLDAPPILEYRAVDMTFQSHRTEVPALSSCSFELRQGEFLAILGPSGCGKSTLLNLASGLLAPSAGEVVFAGRPVTGVNTRVGYVTQKDNLLPWLTVTGNIEMGLKIRKVPARQRQQRLAEAIDLVGLTGFERHYPRQLSGGMRKRVTLARSLIYRPETILMDEPFANLDAQLRLVLQAEMSRIAHETNSSVVWVTHDFEEAITMADRIIVLTGRPATLRAIEVVDLPQPREPIAVRETAEFSRLMKILWALLRSNQEHP